jgi:predicted MFS family arabinose efflux permease
VALTVARDPITVALAVGLMSFAFAGLGPTLDARALETVEDDRDRWAHMRAWGSGSFIVSVAITGALIERTGTATIFVIYVIALLAVAVVTLPLRGSAEGARLPRLSGIATVLRHPPLVRFLAAALLVWSASMSINWYFSIHLLDLGAPGELVGSAWAIGAVVEIPIMSAYPWLVARFGSVGLIVVGAAAFALRAALLLVVTDPVLAAATMAIHGVGFALVLVGGVTYVARHAPPATAATAQGVLSATVFSVALIIGPGVGSWAASAAGVPVMFAVALAASLLGIPAVWLATRESKPAIPAT